MGWFRAVWIAHQLDRLENQYTWNERWSHCLWANDEIICSCPTYIQSDQTKKYIILPTHLPTSQLFSIIHLLHTPHFPLSFSDEPQKSSSSSQSSKSPSSESVKGFKLKGLKVIFCLDFSQRISWHGGTPNLVCLTKGQQQRTGKNTHWKFVSDFKKSFLRRAECNL